MAKAFWALYVLSGKIRVYVGREVFSVTAGECIFLPRRKPHAWLITSEEIHTIAVITPGGFNDALNRLGTPAERMEVPADVDTVTYANADLTERVNVFKQYGVRLLTPEEISKEMPDYPLEAISLLSFCNLLSARVEPRAANAGVKIKA